MSNRIILNEDVVSALEEWTVKNPGFVIAAPAFFDKFELHLQFEDSHITCYAESKSGGFKISVKVNDVLMMVMRLTRLGNKEDGDFKIKYEPRNGYRKGPGLDALIESTSNMVLMANAFLTYGNLEENRVLVAHGRNVDKDKVIVFKLFENKIYAVSTGAHRSPEGIFSVRGHFRRYKSGKVIWIDEYLKGVNKE